MNHAMYNLKTLELEGHQLEEAVNAIFHTILFHRSTGKYTFKTEGKYSVGTVGIEDVDCDRIDLTYVRVPSEGLINKVGAEFKAFCDSLREKEMANVREEPIKGQINLQFFMKNKAAWPRSHECVPWEDWVVTVKIVSLANENERQMSSMKLRKDLYEIIMNVVRVVNNHDLYIPKEPTAQDLDCVYDTSIADVQPYLYKISYHLNGEAKTNEGLIGATVKRISQVLS